MPANRDSVSPTSLFLNEFQLENMISGDNISLTFMYSISPCIIAEETGGAGGGRDGQWQFWCVFF